MHRLQLIIAEKPDQGAKLAAPFKHKKQQGYIEIAPCSQFPEGAYVGWAVGHICELVPPEAYDPIYKRWNLGTLPILPPKFQHKVTPSKAKQFQLLKGLLQRPNVKEIIIASDAGREGEYIVRIIIQLSGVKKPMKRLWISSLTPKSVVQGFSNLMEEEQTRNLYYEAVSRSCADWLVGMNGSRVYSLLFQRRGVREVFSTGRVQSPTLALIVAREKEIQNFKSEPFWELKAQFDMDGLNYEGTWFKGEQSRFSSADEAEQARVRCENKSATITSIQTERKEFQPPQLFNLSALQAAANQIYKYSPQQTLNILQQLYLEGYISYPRSDSAYVTEEEAKQFPDILQKLSRFDSLASYYPLPNESIIGNKRFVNASKVSDHYAIVPTEQVPNLMRLKEEQRRLYELIAKRLIAAHYEKAIINYTKLTTTVDDEDTFVTKGKQIMQEGWRKVLYRQEDDDEETMIPPQLAEGAIGQVASLQVKEGKTQPPKRYTEGQLITLMKTAGKHLDNSELEKVLERTEGLGTEATRAGIISVLKDRKYIEVKKNMVYAMPKGIMLIDALGESVLASAEMTAKWEQRLHEIGQGQASPQSFMEQAKKLTHKLIQDAIDNEKSWSFDIQPLDQEEQNSPSHGKGNAHSDELGPCPICTKPVVDKKVMYGCTGYPNCRFTVSKKILGKAISSATVKRLLAKGETSMLKGFKKGDKVFEAALVWNATDSKIAFQFKASDKDKPK